MVDNLNPIAVGVLVIVLVLVVNAGFDYLNDRIPPPGAMREGKSWFWWLRNLKHSRKFRDGHR